MRYLRGRARPRGGRLGERGTRAAKRWTSDSLSIEHYGTESQQANLLTERSERRGGWMSESDVKRRTIELFPSDGTFFVKERERVRNSEGIGRGDKGISRSLAQLVSE